MIFLISKSYPTKTLHSPYLLRMTIFLSAPTPIAIMLCSLKLTNFSIFNYRLWEALNWVTSKTFCLDQFFYYLYLFCNGYGDTQMYDL